RKPGYEARAAQRDRARPRAGARPSMEHRHRRRVDEDPRAGFRRRERARIARRGSLGARAKSKLGPALRASHARTSATAPPAPAFEAGSGMTDVDLVLATRL